MRRVLVLPIPGSVTHSISAKDKVNWRPKSVALYLKDKLKAIMDTRPDFMCPKYPLPWWMFDYTQRWVVFVLRTQDLAVDLANELATWLPELRRGLENADPNFKTEGTVNLSVPC